MVSILCMTYFPRLFHDPDCFTVSTLSMYTDLGSRRYFDVQCYSCWDLQSFMKNYMEEPNLFFSILLLLLLRIRHRHHQHWIPLHGSHGLPRHVLGGRDTTSVHCHSAFTQGQVVMKMPNSWATLQILQLYHWLNVRLWYLHC